MPEAPVPPLRVWVAAGLLALLLAAVATGAALWLERDLAQQLGERAETRLRRDAGTRAGQRWAVVLGTSLTEYGVAPAPYFSEKTAGRWRVTRLYRQGANLESYTERSRVFQLLQKYPPDVLLLEENLLLFTLPDHHHVPADASAPHEVVQALLHPLNAARGTAMPPVPTDFDAPALGHARPNREDTLHLDAWLADIRRRRVRSLDTTGALHRSLRSLRQRGTRLVLLHVPRPAPLERLIHGETRRDTLQRLIRAYQTRYGMDYWHFDQPLPYGRFVDFAHLNQAGGRVYSAWLAERLESGFFPGKN